MVKRDWYGWMVGYDHERKHNAPFVQYYRLEEWAEDHDVAFHVEHYDDCHILSAVHHLPNGMVSWAYVRYPHSGEEPYSMRPCDSTLDEFVELFSAYGHPMQPTFEIGAVA